MVREFIAPYFETRARRRTLLGIGAGSAVFLTLLTVMFYLRFAAELWPTPFNFPSLLMAAALTSFAVSSSVTCEIGARAARLKDAEPAVRWIAVSVVTWLTFMFLELVEWVRLVFMLRLDWTTTFGATYFSLTVTHWLAVMGCAAWMIWVATDVRKHDVVAVAIYSHFLNAVWLVLFATLYLTNATLSGIS